MEEHIVRINQNCRLCKSELNNVTHSYNISSYVEEINFFYRDDAVDVSKDDPNTQSKKFCQGCYRNMKKIKEEIKYRKKNPKSNKVFQYTLPKYNENVSVYMAPEHEDVRGGAIGAVQEGSGQVADGQAGAGAGQPCI